MDEQSYFLNIASYKLLAKKEVGQNFLIEPRIAEKIVSKLDLQPDDYGLEIGCGTGALTFFLAKSEAKVDAIDIDEAMLAKTGNDFANHSTLTVKYGNACDYDYTPYTKIVGNLPYYITSLILEKVLLGAVRATRLVFMVQKEAGERILAKPSDKDYGPLNILLDLLYRGERAFNVSRNYFAPAPHVDSQVYVLSRKADMAIETAAKVYDLAKKLFLLRRKTIYNNLKHVLGDATKAEAVLSKAGLAPTLRPENLTPEQYLHLTRIVMGEE